MKSMSATGYSSASPDPPFGRARTSSSTKREDSSSGAFAWAIVYSSSSSAVR